MHGIDLAVTAAALPEAWSSRRLGLVDPAREKVLRMDGSPVEEECHGTTEALLVLDGRLEPEVDGVPVPVGAGELFLVPAGTAHAVRPREPGHADDRGTARGVTSPCIRSRRMPSARVDGTCDPGPPIG
ncbi:hypothetical protein K373_05357 [Streptomyces sp. DvalAA-21]|nr:Cupin 2 conserved barrel domain protein [Streptomyces sp. SirexAA-E]PZX33084.1 hypothetical protein K373_05357 [Streptomyces sp. DvalAA-21]RAJ26121.1 hypothetical protein K351_06427 [Streptomyces sp. DpondAA-E10]RAJ39871.1 hypothetical protein K352_06487 [Streptomyces sp. DpondAA-A50]SCD39347.1 Cupin domain-containing protein [Streptomyces sp. BpilaLS-43]SCE44278.1 Cupin domain-containing protein [Streptomyces sp. DpondAA-F4a]SCL98440.1 Cupin domain-containing protein [Streptomyces sp. Dpo